MKFILRTKNGLHLSTEFQACAGGNNIMFFDSKSEAIFVRRNLLGRVNLGYMSSWLEDTYAEEVPDDYEY